MTWKWIRDVILKSRYDRPCILCGKDIEEGEHYLKREGAVNRKRMSLAMHPLCEALTRTWSDDDWASFPEGTLCPRKPIYAPLLDTLDPETRAIWDEKIREEEEIEDRLAKMRERAMRPDPFDWWWREPIWAPPTQVGAKNEAEHHF